MLIFHPPKPFAFREDLRKAAQTPMERLVERLSPAMQRAIQTAAETAQGRIDLDALARLIEQGRISRAVLELDVDRFTSDDLTEATDMLTKALVAGAALGHLELKMPYAFNATNPAAIDAAESLAADLLTAVNDETKQTVRDLIARSFREQITADDTARLIRDVVGLNDRQATALFNYREGLVEDGQSPAQVAKLTEAYGDKLLTDRAATISQTEIHRASAVGQHETWKEAVRTGKLNPNKMLRFWILNLGACEWCQELADINEDGVQIDGQFETPDGDMIDGPEDEHVGGRCSTGLGEA